MKIKTTHLLVGGVLAYFFLQSGLSHSVAAPSSASVPTTQPDRYDVSRWFANPSTAIDQLVYSSVPATTSITAEALVNAIKAGSNIGYSQDMGTYQNYYYVI